MGHLFSAVCADLTSSATADRRLPFAIKFSRQHARACKVDRDGFVSRFLFMARMKSGSQPQP
jgi:hypothetical protein